jgi:hypothetical protein
VPQAEMPMEHRINGRSDVTGGSWALLALWAGLLAVPTALADEDNTRDTSLDLGTIYFSVERWTYEQEMSARIIREAYEVPFSDDPADRDKLRCWVEDRPLSKFGYLYCARMGDIQARRASEVFDRNGLRALGYGTFLQSSQLVNPAQFEKILSEFSGNEQFNEEFVELVENGERPPRYFPSVEEIDQYLLVTKELRALGSEVSRDVTSELAKKHGLTLGRYDEIAKMIQLFPSVSSAVAAREPSQGFQPPSDFFPDLARLALND